MPFKHGVSGNRNGRPLNSGHRQKVFNNLVAPHSEILINKALEMALEGNEAMLKIFLERILPTKPTDEPLNLDLPNMDMTKTSSMLMIGEQILLAVSNNIITPEQGNALLEIVTIQRKNIEASNIAERITEIEFMLKLRKQEKSYD